MERYAEDYVWITGAVKGDKTHTAGDFFFEKQLSELRGFFKGKERKSLEGKIELLEDLEKRLHKSLEQIVKREGYPNVQAFQKVYNKAEELIIEYNEELRVWKKQTEQKKRNR